MNTSEFRRHAHELVDWMADYLETIESRPVRAMVSPGDILRKLPAGPPVQGEPFNRIFADFQEIILPGMTHWQHPSFFAYFPGNSSPPSVLAEMLTAIMGAQCMSWVTSPAATELEDRVMQWLRDMLGLPTQFTGVIQDTASTSTLCAILTAREARSNFTFNSKGLHGSPRYTAYCSRETHSSIEKGIRIAGIGSENLRKVDVDNTYAMRPDALDAAVREDLAHGFLPLMVVNTLGTTGSTAIDPLKHIAKIARKYGLWLHVDAAYAGSALILPEYRHLADGIEGVDSFVVNPHKWLLTNFDCSAYFVRDEAALVRTFEILPEYLKTAEGNRVKNYRDWGIQLGRRFRALKLWFVIRHYGVAGLQEILRRQIAIARDFAEKVGADPDFALLAPVPFNLICFRYVPRGVPPASLEDLNLRLMDELNRSGSLFLTHTKLQGEVALRMVIGQTNVQQRHADAAWDLISSTARRLTPTQERLL